VQSKARRNRLNLPHGTETQTGNAKTGMVIVAYVDERSLVGGLRW